MSSGVATGSPRSPLRWVAVTSRQSRPHPAPGSRPEPMPRASTVTRGRRGSTIAPPRTGVREPEPPGPPGHSATQPPGPPWPVDGAVGAGAPGSTGRPGGRRRQRRPPGGRLAPGRRVGRPRGGTSRPFGVRATGRGADREVDAEDRVDARLGARLDEPHRTVEAVTVGQGQRRLTPRHGPLDQRGGGGGAVLHRVPRRDMEVDEGLARRWQPPGARCPRGLPLGPPLDPPVDSVRARPGPRLPARRGRHVPRPASPPVPRNPRSCRA